MFELNINLKQTFEETARAMRWRLQQKPSVDALRFMVAHKGIGSFKMCQKLDCRGLSNIAKKGKIVGVDGSTNNAGGPFPYLFTLQQALAKVCSSKEEDVVITDAASPLIMKDVITEEEYRDFIKRNLAELEVKAALEALDKFNPRVVLLDGSLVRYKIESAPMWETLKNRALAQDAVLVGVVEGISTNIISSCLEDVLNLGGFPASDWEILFGLLQVGEILEIVPGLFKEGFRTFFMRSSLDPKPIGIDLLEEQQEYLAEVSNLIFTLTPQDGRGIPLWLDIIDKNVRITDAVMEGLLNAYLGEDYAEFLKPKRERRQM